MALFSEWMQGCAKKALDNAGIVRGDVSPTIRWVPIISANNSPEFYRDGIADI